MSDDYAALLTTLIVTVLAVGTIQTYTLMRRLGDSQTADVRRTVEARLRVLDAMRRGGAPDPEDLRAAHVSTVSFLALSQRNLSAYTAGVVWSLVVVVLGVQQVKILMWAGSADHGDSPNLARDSFYLVAVSVGLLLAEGVVRAFVRTFVDQRESLKPLHAYPREERAEMLAAVRHFHRTGEAPAPAPPRAPAEPAPPAPPAAP
ncbi:hypothetical protein ABZZ79_34665 [Streptomyces sp. NPDC006458]|uniref:hypothetical protein n=1 Tax=Streptomyces sp. NPDC006458 TaxID=3154302 RepID=UPI0033A4A199